MKTRVRCSTILALLSLFVLRPGALRAEDCNGNGAPDSQDIARGNSPDCNANAIPDECDLSGVRFAATAYYPVPRGASLVRSADVDGDDDQDLVVATAAGGGFVSVLRNRGDGTFAAAEEYAVPNAPLDLALADLNGDHRVDMAVAGSGGLMILTNAGDGTFGPHVDYATQRTRAIVARDLDGDDDNDLAMISWNYGYNIARVRVWLNNGGGSFPTTMNYDFGHSLGDLVAADLDGDGDLDLATANGNYTCECIYILLNEGGGSFAAPVTRNVGAIPTGLAGGELDGDGDFDLVVHLNASAHRTLFNNGDASFADGPAMALAWPIGSLEAVDLDADGDADLAAAGASDDRIVFYLNRGNGVFNVGLYLKVRAGALGNHPIALAAADFDGDEQPDLATANDGSNDVAVLLNRSIEPVSRDRNRTGVPDECECWKPCDSNGDTDVDEEDLIAFTGCASGPTIDCMPGCVGWDLDCDGDVDQSDFAAFQRCFSGTDNPADAGCTNG